MKRNDLSALMELLETRRLLGGDPFPSLSLLEHPDNPVVRMTTERGDIFIELLANEAPQTVELFLRQVSEFALNQTFFNRLTPGVALEGAMWSLLPDLNQDGTYGLDDLFRNGGHVDVLGETNRANTERTIAATQRPDGFMGFLEPAVLVINLGDNTVTHPSEQYVVFARILDDNSWDVVQDIAALPLADFTGADNIEMAAGFVAAQLNSVPVDAAYTNGDPVSPEIVVQAMDLSLIRQFGAPDHYRHTIYTAEGFTGSTISEFIPIANPNDAEVHYEVRVRYERNSEEFGYIRDDLVIRSTIAANSRGGVTVSTSETWQTAPVASNRPYSVEIISTLPLAANSSRYDFGVATGEAFTSTLDTTWFIGDVEKAMGNDFLLVYNPNPIATQVTLTFTNEANETLDPITLTLEAFRRGGLNIRDRVELANGRYSVIVQATQSVLAQISHFGLTALAPPIDGFAAIGESGAPSTVGVVPIGFEGGTPFDPFSTMTFFNPSKGEAVVSLDIYVSGSSAPVQSIANVATLASGERARVRLETLIQVADEGPLTIVYRSTVPVFSAASFVRNEDSYSAPVGIVASTGVHFAEGFTEPARTGDALEEMLNIFNPYGEAFGVTDQAADVTLTFRYADGFTFSIDRSVAGGSMLTIDVSRLAEIIEQAETNDRFYYSIEVMSSVPILAQMRHTDRTLNLPGNLGGGFTTLGMAFGTLVRVDELQPG